MTNGDLFVTGLHKAFGAQAVLSGVDLRVPEGSFTAVLGPSGCGKTTLLRILAGFERPDSGTVAVGDVVLDDATRHLPPERRRLGYVSQDGTLFPHLTVAQNVGFGLPRRERRAGAVAGLIDAVGLGGMAHRYPHQLSGGQQQRVAIARALAVTPQIVLLDEPFAALDDSLRHAVRADVRAILREWGATAILVTHDQDEALSTADLVAVMRDGRIAQMATPHEIYDHPVDAALATLLGGANLVPGEVTPTGVRTAFGLIALRDGARPRPRGPVRVLVRPEQVALTEGDAPSGVRGRVARTWFHGHDVVVDVTVDDGHDVEAISARVIGTDRFAPGDAVTVTVVGHVEAFDEPARADTGAPGDAPPA